MFPFLLCFSLLFSAICKASSDNHFAFLHFFFLGMVLIPASCTMSWTSIHSSLGTLSDLIPWIYFSLPLYNHKGFGKHPLPTTQESIHGHHQLVNTEIRLIIFFAAKDGEALYSQQKQDRELNMAQIMNSFLSNSNTVVNKKGSLLYEISSSLVLIPFSQSSSNDISH